jgi:hypothetical protein
LVRKLPAPVIFRLRVNCVERFPSKSGADAKKGKWAVAGAPSLFSAPLRRQNVSSTLAHQLAPLSASSKPSR